MSYSDRRDLEGWDVEQDHQDGERSRAERRAQPCECREHRCEPEPRQIARYPVRVGPSGGLLALCARCAIAGHMATRRAA